MGSFVSVVTVIDTRFSTTYRIGPNKEREAGE